MARAVLFIFKEGRLVIVVGNKSRVVFVCENLVLKLEDDILLDEGRKDLDIELLARSVFYELLLLFVENYHINVLATHLRQFDCLFNKSSLSFRISHITLIPILNKLDAIYFLLTHGFCLVWSKSISKLSYYIKKRSK